jgi:surface protein
VFNTAKAFNQDISDWNTAKGTIMANMFQDATLFNQDISGWNVASVSNMVDLFLDATAFNGNLARWNVRPRTCGVGRFSLQTERSTRPLAGTVCHHSHWVVRWHDGAVRLQQALHF